MSENEGVMECPMCTSIAHFELLNQGSILGKVELVCTACKTPISTGVPAIEKYKELYPHEEEVEEVTKESLIENGQLSIESQHALLKDYKSVLGMAQTAWNFIRSKGLEHEIYRLREGINEGAMRLEAYELELEDSLKE